MKQSSRLHECKFPSYCFLHSKHNTYQLVPPSIHLCHDDAKDKDFELELSWIGPETGGLHLPVPKDLYEEADKKGRDALDADMED